MNQDAPISLNASVVMPRGNGGLDVDLSAMQSTSRNWLKINELRVFIDPGESESIGSDSELDFGFMVDVAISVGKEDLTTGFIGTSIHPTGELIAYIPAFLLGPRIYRRFSTINNDNLEFNAGANAYADQNAYTWTLPRPLYLPPNTPIKFKVRRSSTIALLDDAALYANPFTVEVAAVGTRLATKPRLSTRAIPHIHAWSPRNANSLRVESGEAFRNLHKQPLNLTRLIGGTATNAGASIDGSTFGPAASIITDPTLIQIYDANGNDVLVSVPPVPLSPSNPNAPVPISSLFLAKTNSVRISDRLEVNQTYRMVVSPVSAAPADLFLRLPMIGLESFREVPA
jgi:hypothetical protein